MGMAVVWVASVVRSTIRACGAHSRVACRRGSGVGGGGWVDVKAKAPRARGNKVRAGAAGRRRERGRSKTCILRQLLDIKIINNCDAWQGRRVSAGASGDEAMVLAVCAANGRSTGRGSVEGGAMA
ncbi:hypothetical protein B0H17DRAFT_388706 [Mycena rosella]|uniref:Uncharacterized protein n=1 Tax=Mycena rosella TaxID=1033263 RepID=A0AAD7CN05_MYCRO|nr:hypothetical protein B0H17DRAFT_388706 [Mycena rosella]